MPHVSPLRPDDPRRIGRYRLTGRLDRLAVSGEVGVFAARKADGQAATVTLMSQERAGGAAARDRFLAEARAARRVPPFCIARVLEAGFEGWRPYLVTEYVPGPSLAEAIGAEGPLTGQALRAVAIGSATGLAALHQAGLVHGDFRPETVVLGPDGLRVVHFSITPPYGPATPAADMLAWGLAVLYAALGRRPVSLPDARRNAGALPSDLQAVVGLCLSPDPAGRLTARGALMPLLSGHDLSVGLLALGGKLAQRAARRLPEEAAPVAADERRRGSRSAAVAWVAACAVCLAVIAGGALYISHRAKTPPAPGATAPGPGSPGGHPSRTAGRQGVPAAFAGRWMGTVRQSAPVLSVTVRISLPAGALAGTVSYPQLDCAGTLAVLSAGPAKLTLAQRIATGRRNCENGTIALSPRPGGKLLFTFARAGGASPPSGVLSRHR